MSNFQGDLTKQLDRKGFIISLVIGIVLMLIWASLAIVIPNGWPMVILNIGLFLLSCLIIGMPSFKYLRRHMARVLALAVAIAIMMTMVVLIRSLFLTLFGVL